jgi:hypothetical protein
VLLVSQEERDRFIGEFWSDVRARLIDAHGRAAEDADRGIGLYRHEVFRRGVGDLVFHQGVERTAEVIAGILDHGLPNPS